MDGVRETQVGKNERGPVFFIIIIIKPLLSAARCLIRIKNKKKNFFFVEQSDDVRGYGAMTMVYEFKMSSGETGISGWADEFLFFPINRTRIAIWLPAKQLKLELARFHSYDEVVAIWRALFPGFG